jgi:hypothetical protein
MVYFQAIKSNDRPRNRLRDPGDATFQVSLPTYAIDEGNANFVPRTRRFLW